MGKLKPTFFDKIFGRKDRYKDIIELRHQIDHMSKLWQGVDIVTQLQNYRQINYSMHKFTMFTLDEERMSEVLGIDAVIERLTNDRNKIIDVLKNVKEIDLSDIINKIREEKLNNVLS